MPSRLQQHHVYHLSRLGELTKLFWERSLDTVAIGLIAIFIPIYLLRLGYAPSHIFWFYALTGLVMTLVYPLGFALMSRLGPNRTLVAANAFNGLFFILLAALPADPRLLWLAVLPRALYSACYFPAFTINFVAARAHRATGTQVGLFNATALALSGLAPALGGLIAARYGLPAVCLVVIATIIAANIPLLLGPDRIKPPALAIHRIPWPARMDFLANGLYNIPVFVDTVIWPLLISLFIASYFGIGLVSSLLTLTAIAISLYVGRRADRVGERRFINQGVAAGVVANLSRLFATTPLGVAGANVVAGTSDALLANSFITRYYKNADTAQLVEYTFGMEVAHSIIWTLYFTLVAVLAHFLPLKLVLLSGILVAIPAMLGVRLIHPSPVTSGAPTQPSAAADR